MRNLHREPPAEIGPHSLYIRRDRFRTDAVPPTAGFEAEQSRNRTTDPSHGSVLTFTASS
jgi:hypothetical protein